MTNFLCMTCGTQFDASEAPPPRCPICDDERQYIGPGGQRWTTLEQLSGGHDNVFRILEPGTTLRFPPIAKSGTVGGANGGTT